MEQWVKWPASTLYEASTLGRVRKITGQILYQWKNKRTQYYYVCVGRSVPVHRIISETFLPNPHTKKCVNHKNLVRTDNRLENLEWATHSENVLHAIEKGAFSKAHLKLKLTMRGEGNKNAKLSPKNVHEVLWLKKTYGLGGTKLSRMYRISDTAIKMILRKETWKHI